MRQNPLVVNDQARKMVSRYTTEELWDRYKAAKLMDDKEEVAIFRKALKIVGRLK